MWWYNGEHVLIERPVCQLRFILKPSSFPLHPTSPSLWLFQTAVSPQITRATTLVLSKIIYKNYLNWLFIGRSPAQLSGDKRLCSDFLNNAWAFCSHQMPVLYSKYLFSFFRYTMNSTMKKSIKIKLYSLLAKKKKEKKKEPGGRKKRKK